MGQKDSQEKLNLDSKLREKFPSFRPDLHSPKGHIYTVLYVNKMHLQYLWECICAICTLWNWIFWPDLELCVSQGLTCRLWSTETSCDFLSCNCVIHFGQPLSPSPQLFLHLWMFWLVVCLGFLYTASWLLQGSWLATLAASLPPVLPLPALCIWPLVTPLHVLFLLWIKVDIYTTCISAIIIQVCVNTYWRMLCGHERFFLTVRCFRCVS